jgi:hypothetical protein
MQLREETRSTDFHSERREVMDHQEFIDKARTKVNDNADRVISAVSSRISNAIKEDRNLAIGTLSSELSSELELPNAFVKTLVGAYVEANEELVLALGKGNGIMLKSKYEVLQKKQEEVKAETTYSKFTSKVRGLGFKDKTQFNAARRELGEKPTLAALKIWIEAKQ